MSGWASVGEGLGALFGGGKAREEAVYREQLDANATLAQKLAVADRERMRTMARQDIAANADLDPLTRALILGESGSDYSAAQQGRLHGQTYGFRNEAATAARSGDWNALNPMLALIDGKALRTNTIEGGGRFVGNTYDTDAGLGTTEFGNADIARVNAATGANNALIEQRNAQANAANMRAILYGEQATNQTSRAGSDPGVYGTQDLSDAIEARTKIQELNRSRRLTAGMPGYIDPDAIAIPVPGTPKGAAVAPTSTAPGSPTMPKRVAGSPYDEGTIVEGPNTQLFIIENGVPVPLM